jgi:hypothetical protein
MLGSTHHHLGSACHRLGRICRNWEAYFSTWEVYYTTWDGNSTITGGRTGGTVAKKTVAEGAHRATRVAKARLERKKPFVVIR